MFRLVSSRRLPRLALCRGGPCGSGLPVDCSMPCASTLGSCCCRARRTLIGHGLAVTTSQRSIMRPTPDALDTFVVVGPSARDRAGGRPVGTQQVMPSPQGTPLARDVPPRRGGGRPVAVPSPTSRPSPMVPLSSRSRRGRLRSPRSRRTGTGPRAAAGQGSGRLEGDGRAFSSNTYVAAHLADPGPRV